MIIIIDKILLFSLPWQDYSKNQIVALASILHNSVHETVRPKEFKKWLELFCAIIGKETPTAKASKTEVKAEIPKMKRAYYYLFP